MIALSTSTFGVMATLPRQHEYLLVCAALDAILRNRGDWLADIGTWFRSEFFSDQELRAIYDVLLQIQQQGAPLTEFEVLSRLPLEDSPLESRAARLYGLWCDCAVQSAHLRYYARRVHEEHRRQSASQELIGLSHDLRDAEDPDAVLSEVTSLASRYAPAAETRTADNQRVLDELLEEDQCRQERVSRTSRAEMRLSRPSACAVLQPGDEPDRDVPPLGINTRTTALRQQ
jgi:replicative DNA helicase